MIIRVPVEGLVRIRNKPKGQGALTLWRLQREGQVETWKESDKVGALTRWEIQGGTSWDTERKRASRERRKEKGVSRQRVGCST